VRILSTIDRELLKPSASVALHKHSNALVDVLPPEADSSITMLSAGESRSLFSCVILQYFSDFFYDDSCSYVFKFLDNTLCCILRISVE